MAHHGDDARSIYEKMFSDNLRQLGLGPTGKFPEGHLNENDEGEIRIAIAEVDGKIVINFGKPTTWIGFTKQQAREIANELIERANA